MTLESTLQTNLSNWRPTGRESVAFALPDTDWTVTLTGDRCDDLGCRLSEITLSRPTAPPGLELKDWAQALCDRPMPLDPLKVIEVDAGAHKAVLRSDLPTLKEDSRLYYELFLQGTTQARLNRYQAPKDGPGRREEISYVLTQELLAKVLDHLAQ